MEVQTIVSYMQVFLSFGNICILLYALYKFLSKPHSSLEQRVTTLEVETKDIKTSLLAGNDRFREQESVNDEQAEANEAFAMCMLSFVDFELAFCTHTNYMDTEDLHKAKETLRIYLSKARKIK